MKYSRFFTFFPVGGLLCLLLWVCAAGADDVHGFPGVPLYPGLEDISADANIAPDDIDDACVVYECSGEEVGERYAEDPEAFAAQVADYYRDKLAKQDWDYLGEGARRHHWGRKNEALTVRVLDYCAIEYRRLGLEEARANMGTMEDKDFFPALTGCVKAAQAVCTRCGAGDFGALQQKSQEYMARGDVEGLEAYEAELRKESRQAMWQALKPYGVTPERLAELFEDREDLADRWVQEYGAFMAENAMGWTMVLQLAE